MSFKKVKGYIECVGNDFHQKVEFYEGKNIIGRSKAQCNVVINNAVFSKKHAIMECNNQIVTIRDCQSRNGIYLNDFDHPIESEKEIAINPFKDILFLSDIQCKILPFWSEEDEKQVQVKNIEINNEQHTDEEKDDVQSEGFQNSKEKDRQSQTEENHHKKERKASKKRQSKPKSQENNEEIEKRKTKKPVRKSKSKGPVQTKEEKKRASSNETLAKKKKKTNTKSLDKERQSETPTKNKRIPTVPAYELRQFSSKKVLLSGYTSSFIPTVRISFVESYMQDFDALLMGKYQRTFKLLFAICRGVPIISSSWLIECEHRRSIEPFQKYHLNCPQKETLINSVQKVKKGFKVFEKMKFHLFSDDYHMPKDQIMDLIEEGGGFVITSLKKKEKEKEALKSIVFILPNDYQKSAVKQINKLADNIRIYKVELILDACLRQTVNLDEHQIKSHD